MKGRWKPRWKMDGLLVILLVVIVFFSILNPLFFSMTNLLTILRQIIITGVMACGLLFVIMGGNFDLSIGSLLTLTAIVCVKVHDTNGVYAAICVAIVVGVAVGFVNGMLVGYLKLNSMIVTLSVQNLLTVIILIYSEGKVTKVQTDSWLPYLDKGKFLGLPISLYIYAVIICWCWYLLQKKVYGKKIRAVGGNSIASRFSGVNDRRVVLQSYMLCGAAAAIGGILYASRVMSVQVEAGSGYETSVLTIVILAGARITGGEGKIGRTVIAAAIIGCLNNGFIMIGLPYYFQWIVQWITIILVVWLTTNPQMKENIKGRLQHAFNR